MIALADWAQGMITRASAPGNEVDEIHHDAYLDHRIGGKTHMEPSLIDALPIGRVGGVCRATFQHSIVC
jgi:hypothetical protein